MTRTHSSGIPGLVEAGRRAGLGAEELDNFQKMMIQENCSMQHASTLMVNMIRKRKPEQIIFRSSKLAGDGSVVYASDLGRRAFVFRVRN